VETVTAVALNALIRHRQARVQRRQEPSVVHGDNVSRSDPSRWSPHETPLQHFGVPPEPNGSANSVRWRSQASLNQWSPFFWCDAKAFS